MSKRIKTTSLPDRDAFTAAVDQVADLATQIALIEARQARAVQRVQAAYAERMEPLQAQQKALIAQAEKYAEAHRADLLPKEKKSAETSLAVYGFRTGNPTVKTLAKYAWDHVLMLLAAKKLYQFVRTKPEVDKERILSAYRKEDGVLVLRAKVPAKDLQPEIPEEVIAPSVIGVRIIQDEAFYVSPKVEAAQPIKAA